MFRGIFFLLFFVCELAKFWRQSMAKVSKDYKYYSLLNDYVFKWIFGNQENPKLLICLLNAILHLKGKDKIVGITFLNPINLKQYETDKTSVVDTKVKDANNQTYNIEVQAQPQLSYNLRALYYLTKLYGSQLLKGEKYNELKKSIGISITAFEVDVGYELQERFMMTNERGDLKISDGIELHFINLKKYDDSKKHSLKTPFEKWLHVLRFSERYAKMGTKVEKELLKEEGIAMVIELLQKINADVQARSLLEAKERYLIDTSLERYAAYKKGAEEERQKQHKKLKAIKAQNKLELQELALKKDQELRELELKKEQEIRNLAQEKKQEKLLVAKSLLNDGMPAKKVAQILKLTESEVESLL